MKKIDFKAMSSGARSAFVGAALAVVAAVAAIIYGAVYEQYADFVVVLCLLGGAALWAAYALVDKACTEWFCLLGEAVAGFGLGLFIVNIYNVLADTWGNLQQYGSLTGAFNFFNSQGGPIPPVAITAVALAACIFGIMSCFKGKETA